MNLRALGIQLLTFSLVAAATLAQGAGVILGQTTWTSGNGHTYAIVSFPEQDWVSASADVATTLPGYHLATITSQAEQDFIWDFFVATTGGIYDWWLGGFQPIEPETDPAAGWMWVTGEPWVYTNWAPGEPNDANGIEDHLAFESWGQWNDCCTTPGSTVWGGYFAEVVPIPPSIYLVGSGLLALFGISRSKKRA
jgi:hypothetical protein